ncbi:c-type cytochrome [Larkinella arboricola]|uniref:Cytochrome c553 n=1 Tax=Larkinella arboricola TaxID=643671 RepID=A0A327X7H9_LARAB|nr:c-type cytochrome [Larkinella arboricola]RAK02168.1 cytochrome c553 [Larkinella arboricola]
MHTDFIGFSSLKMYSRTAINRVVIVLIILLGSYRSQAQDAAKGKELYSTLCQQCHAVTDEKVIGPGLKGINQRRDEAWLIKWIKNPQAMISSGDAYATALYAKYQPVVMQSFPDLSDDDIKNILAHVEAANAAPAGGDAPGVGAQAGGGAQAAASESPSGLFTVVLVALLVVMLLVLGVLLVLVTILSKAVAPAPGVETTEQTKSFSQRLKDITGNSALRSIVLWLFVFVVIKQTFDGLYSVGVSQGYAPKQPIAFSHKLHAGQYQVNCNYCHTAVYKGKLATIPSANICMNCHGEIKRESPEIQKIYKAIETDTPIEWVRVHNLPDLAYFNHAQHTNVGQVQCQTCHGEVEKMEVMEQRSSLTMGWCIDCHRKTEVATKDNAYYDKLVALHKKGSKEPLRVANIGGLECSKCHF